MYNKEMFIKYIKTDDEGRILISVQNHLQEELKKDNVRQEIKELLVETLNDNFEKLEIGKNICRVTVNENSEQAVQTIENKIDETLQMAGEIMSQMGNNKAD